MIKVECIDNTEDLLGLESEWHELFEADSRCCLTMNWDWQLTWWEVFGELGELRVLTARDDAGMLVGLLPMYVQHVRAAGLVPMCRLELLGRGEPESDEICSDYLDMIVRPGRENEVVRTMLDFLSTSMRNDFDEVWLTSLAEDSRLVNVVPALALQTGLACEVLPRSRCVVIEFPDSYETLLASFRPRLRWQIRRDRRKLQELGKLEYRLLSSGPEADAAYRTFIELHQQRWNYTGRPGCFASARFTAFHKKLRRRWNGTDRIRILLASLDGRAFAGTWEFADRDTLLAYQTGWDPSFSQKNISPGLLVQGLTFEQGIAHGFRHYDFLEDATPHKQRFSPRLRSTFSVRLTPPTLKAKAARSARKLRQTLGAVRRRMRRTREKGIGRD